MQKKMQAKSLEKNKLNVILNSKSNSEGLKNLVGKPINQPSESITAKVSSGFKTSNPTLVKKRVPLTSSGMKHYSQMPLKMGIVKSVTRSGPDLGNSQLNPGFSRNADKAPSKRSILYSSKKKKIAKTRLPSIQASRDKKTRD
jgi:hypothetical protein